MTERASRASRPGGHWSASSGWVISSVTAVSRALAAAVMVTLVVAQPTGAGQGVEAASVRRHLAGQTQPERLRCLYNGYLLTVDPSKALAAGSTANRSTLWVLHAILIDPESGRIVATYPALGTPAIAGGPVAKVVSAYPALASSETPPAPGIKVAQLVGYWRQLGVKEALLQAVGWTDLQGAVATPGLADTHFHLSSWSKKLPAPGQRFGYYADLSDPTYYVNPGTWTRKCARESMWRIVADANKHLMETGDDGMFLHGYLYGEVDSGPSGEQQAAYLYSSSASCTGASFNPLFLLNRVGAKALTVPADTCLSDPGTWPAIDYTVLPALLVQTSGQSCWYNSALLAAYNKKQEDNGAKVAPVNLASVVSLSSDSGTWVLTLAADATGSDVLFTVATPYQVDVVVGSAGGTLTVPFDIVSTSSAQKTLTGQPMISELATSVFSGTPTSLQVKPFYRRIVECIPKSSWDAAIAYWNESPSSDPVSYGSWDPRNPYTTNWYNGSKRGLIQYFFDAAAQAWRPTGYAEHYPMRDALAAVVVGSPDVDDLIEHRRRTASWCHRHGLTMANDIMFYRRNGEGKEFSSYEAVTFDHSGDAAFFERVGLDPSTATGNLNLRVGVYYYIETLDQVDEALRLAHDATAGSDLDRLKPPAGHAEYPGWIRWLGWKLQLDGAAFTRNFLSSAPLVKMRQTDPFTIVNDTGHQVSFYDHSYGLLTMTDVQEQVFSSRESAALYWLVRESEPSTQFHNPQIPRNWSPLARGVASLLGVVVDRDKLTTDLGKLSHMTLSTAQATQLAGKIATVVEQVNDAWERTLAVIIKIWYERSRSPAGLPEMPSQTVCHNSGDGAVDLWARAIKQLKSDIEQLPTRWADLPARWKAVVPEGADLGAIRRVFRDERFRIEHLTFISSQVIDTVKGTGGIDASTMAAGRNVVVSLQPAIFLLDGGTGSGFPIAQELWDIPHATNPWGGLPARPRSNHIDALTTFLANDIPMTLNTDPPAMRDPRPALTLLGAVTRSPIEIDPSHWVDQTSSEPTVRPVDYLAGKVYPPFGLLTGATTNPLQLTVEQALAAMTFWGAYAARMEREIGALSAPLAGGQPGWFADIVVWRVNPFAIRGTDGPTLESMARSSDNEAGRLATVNAVISRFLPQMTIVAGIPVYTRS